MRLLTAPSRRRLLRIRLGRLPMLTPSLAFLRTISLLSFSINEEYDNPLVGLLGCSDYSYSIHTVYKLSAHGVIVRGVGVA
jgi:hypothetical protein